MLKRISIPLACVALGAMHSALAAGYDQGQWVTTFLAGTQLMGHGTIQSGASGQIADLGTLDPALSGTAASTQLNHLSMHDAFRIGPSLGIETGYMAEANVEPFARLTFSQLRGRDATLGELTATGPATAHAIMADFDDQNSWAFDLGVRYFPVDYGTARPFLAAFVGVDRTEPLRADLSVPGLTDLGSQTLLQRETRLNGGVEGGLNVQLSNQADLNFSVGADYVTARHEESSAFEPLGLDPVRITDRRWSFPIDVGVNYRF